MELTAEQEAAIQEVRPKLWRKCEHRGYKYAETCCGDCTDEILRDLARRLLEPVELERAAEREHRKINARLLENMSLRCEQREKEIAWAQGQPSSLRQDAHAPDCQYPVMYCRCRVAR